MLYLIIWMFPSLLWSQNADTTVVFTFEDYYTMIMSYHPVVKQADLLSEQAVQELRMARGAFDPKIEVDWNKKSFKDTEYYNTLKGALKIPTWLPITPEIGFEQNRGAYLNPEKYISEGADNRQVYGGVSVSVGRGLIIDERRAVVNQARVFQDMAEAEQVKMINKLFLTAAKDYWDWYYAHYNYLLLQQSIDLAQDIFNRTSFGYRQGEVAAIDTVQAFITLQKRIIDFQQANVDRITASLKMSNHLWSEEGVPLELQDNARPEAVRMETIHDYELERLLELARSNHPELRKLELKNQVLQIDQRLARANMLPRLDVGYYLLDQPLDSKGDQTDVAFDENYKVGVNFSFPLFLRKERAKLNQADLKITDNNYERDFREREIINEINASFTSLINTSEIAARQQQMVQAYNRIVEAEKLNLQNGESDLFKINVQLDKLIEAQGKLIKLNATYKKDQAYLYWSAGISGYNNIESE